MATYAQVQNISNDTQWLRDNVATNASLSGNFSSVIARLSAMNSTLGNILNITNDTNTLDQNLSQQMANLQTNITWIINNVATSSEINSNFTETFNRLLGLNSSLIDIKDYLYTNISSALAEVNYTTHGVATYLYNNITNMLAEVNYTTHDATNYLYTNITNRLSELNITNHDIYTYLMTNISSQLNLLNQSDLSNLTGILDGINNLQSDILFMKNNMFYQGNATGSFLVDYVANVVTGPGNREDLWIATRDLLGNEKTAVSAECYIMKQGAVVYNATNATSIDAGGVHAYWDVAANQTDGEYYWNCTITGSIMHLEVPFFVSDTRIPDFTIDSLVAGSPRYPNEQALIEATFSNENGTAVEPDAINLTLYTSNGNVWATATKLDFSRNGYNVWSYAKDIESNPTTGMYSVQMMASYNGMTSSKTVQFRIATGGPYKVYLQCPETSYVGGDLVCNVILQDEGEAATESISTAWVDENNNGVLDVGEPQASFSKRTVPLQNITQPVAINIPSTQLTGLYIVRVETSYVNSAQPDSTASDSVLFTASTSGGSETGGTGSNGGSGGGGSGSGLNGTGINASQGMCIPSSSAGAAQTCASQEQFRDVLVRILDDYKVVAPDSKLLVELTIYNIGTDDMKNALVKYCIKKESGEIVNCIEESDVISAKLQLIKELLIPKDLPDGKYYLSAEVSYDNKNVSSDTTFTVKSVSSPANKETPGILRGGILGVITSVFYGLDFNKVYIIILTLIVLLLILLSHSRNKPEKPEKEKPYRHIIIDRRNPSREKSEHVTEHVKETIREKPSEHYVKDAEEKSEEYIPEDVKEKLEDKFEDKSEHLSEDEYKSTSEPKSNKLSTEAIFIEPKDVSLGMQIDNRLRESSQLLEREEENEQLEKEKKKNIEQLKIILHTICSEDKVFVLSNHKRLNSIMDLLGYLPGMPEEIFNHHTKQGRNDFANWIKGVFEEKELAKLVEKCDNTETLISTLRDYFRL